MENDHDVQSKLIIKKNSFAPARRFLNHPDLILCLVDEK